MEDNNVFSVKKNGSIECDAPVKFKKNIFFPFLPYMRIMLLLSLGLNMLLFGCLWVLEARVSKLESKHVDPTPLVVTFGVD